MNFFKVEANGKTGESDRAEELSKSFSNINQTSAFKFILETMDNIYTQSNKDVDIIDIKDLSPSVVARARGIREAISKLRNQIMYYMNYNRNDRG